mgnify:CR=1 FL=1
MINFIKNEGDYFSTTFFTEDFIKKVKQRSAFDNDAIKGFEQKIGSIKEPYYAFKKQILEGNNRVRDKINLAHEFHSKLLKALGYEADKGKYGELFHFTDEEVLPVRHQYHRGENLHLMILEMQPMIKVGEEEPDGLFNQRYNVEDEEGSKHQRYHRSQWKDVWGELPEGVTISPSVIEDAVGKLCLLDKNKRPKYILLLAGNKIFLVDTEKWFKGALLEFDVEVLVEEGQVEKSFWSLFYLLLSKDTLAPDSDMVLMDQIDEDSHKSAYEVTKDLKEGIIHAVEMLANEALYYKEYVQGKDIDETKINFANEVKDDALTLVYRLLFLFYAEARSDLDILPMQDETYLKGYSLEMLRDLEQANLYGEDSKNGYFFDESLKKLFQLLSTGFNEKAASDTVVVDGIETNALSSKSFRVRHIDSPMFDNGRLKQLGDVQLRNSVWQDIICQLSLSKVKKGKDRGRISYANLGVNQLGSVYESLLAYRGFYADQKYIEVHEEGKPEKGTYVVPLARQDDFKDDEILKDENGKYVIIEKGQFIYRLSGRDRKNSASFYTPEVLTKSTVKYTLKGIKECLDKKEMKALDLLDLKLLEPAMGAGAFHNELINQLAEMYLTHRQDELKKKVNPDLYIEELQKVKAYIATNNAYGVDLNATAIELGKLSLWLNVIHKDMETPFFGYRLGHGNAVIGAWLKVYNKKQFIFEKDSATERKSKKKKEWWKKAPKRIELTANGNNRKQDEIYHFLLPDENMVPSSKIQMLRAEFEKEAKAVTNWRSEFTNPIMEKEFQTLQKISAAIDVLFEEHYKFQASLNSETSIKSNFFGAEDEKDQHKLDLKTFKEKEKLAEQRSDTNAPYYKLKMIMDYWCSLWFWDMRKANQLPDRAKWYADIEKILDIKLEEINLEEEVDVMEVEEEVVQQDLFGDSAPKQQKLKAYKQDKPQLLKAISNAMKNKADNLSDSLFENERSKIVIELAEQHRFFHNELEFIEVFKERGGFDVIAGNPPWLKLTFEGKSVISEVAPEVEVKDMDASEVEIFVPKLFEKFDGLKDLYINDYVSTDSTSEFLNAYQNYPLLKGQQTNLYKCIIENSFSITSANGFIGLLHPETIFDDPNGQPLRKEIYPRLKYYFRYQNALNLFPEVGHRKKYCSVIYTGNVSDILFEAVNNLFHPSTIDASLAHNGKGLVEGVKRYNESSDKFEWNLSGHLDRVVKIGETELKLFANVFEGGAEWSSCKMVSFHTNEMTNIVRTLSEFPSKVIDYTYLTEECHHQTNAVKKFKVLKKETKYAEIDKYELIYSGPHFYVSQPIYKIPREKCTEKGHYDVVDLTAIREKFSPRSNYIPSKDLNKFLSSMPKFKGEPWVEKYKLGFSKMLNLEGERTLQGAILAPKVSHINGLISVVFENETDLIEFCGLSSSIPLDFFVKTLGASNLTDSRIKALPLGVKEKYLSAIYSRVLRLNCLIENYDTIWEDHWEKEFVEEKWSLNDSRLSDWNVLSKQWDQNNMLRNYFERRQALVELDVICSMTLGLDLDQLVSMYTIQFPVLRQNENDTWYDQKGNIVFTCSKGLTGIGLDRSEWDRIKDMKSGETYEHTIEKSELYKGQKVTYHAPFDKCDRVEDYKTAWAHFEKVFKEK